MELDPRNLTDICLNNDLCFQVCVRNGNEFIEYYKLSMRKERIDCEYLSENKDSNGLHQCFYYPARQLETNSYKNDKG